MAKVNLSVDVEDNIEALAVVGITGSAGFLHYPTCPQRQ